MYSLQLTSRFTQQQCQTIHIPHLTHIIPSKKSPFIAITNSVHKPPTIQQTPQEHLPCPKLPSHISPCLTTPIKPTQHPTIPNKPRSHTHTTHTPHQAPHSQHHKTFYTPHTHLTHKKLKQTNNLLHKPPSNTNPHPVSPLLTPIPAPKPP